MNRVKSQKYDKKDVEASMSENESQAAGTATGGEDEEEDLLYTHKPDSRDGSMRWNSTLCRKSGR